MNNKEYEQKKLECWKQFCKDNSLIDKVHISVPTAFAYAFDRAFALGKETKTITQEEIRKAALGYGKENMWYPDTSYESDINAMIESFADAFEVGANFALGKQEKDGIDLKKLDEMLDDTLKKETKESLNQWLSEKDADTVTIKKKEILSTLQMCQIYG